MNEKGLLEKLNKELTWLWEADGRIEFSVNLSDKAKGIDPPFGTVTVEAGSEQVPTPCYGESTIGSPDKSKYNVLMALVRAVEQARRQSAE